MDKAQTPPTRLNGHRVVMHGPRKNMTDMGAFVVLIDRETDKHVRYVVATWSPQEGDGWWSGNYTDDHGKALGMFRERLAAQ